MNLIKYDCYILLAATYFKKDPSKITKQERSFIKSKLLTWTYGGKV
jgi:hypothetical protein